MNKSNILSREEIILLSRQLGIAINSGIPLTQSIEIIAEKTDNAALKEVLNKIHSDLTMSMQLSDAVKTHENYLTPFFVQMIVIGEESGTLVEVLNQIADSYEKQMESDNKLKTAVTYPILLSVLMLGVIVLLVVQVMPMFDGVLRSLGGELPPFTAAILSFSLFIKNNIIFIASAVFGYRHRLGSLRKNAFGTFQIRPSEIQAACYQRHQQRHACCQIRKKPRHARQERHVYSAGIYTYQAYDEQPLC